MAIQGLVTRGWLAVFAAGPDGFLGHTRQTSRNNAWADWEVIGPPITGDPSVSHNPDGRVEVFANGPGGLLGHMWETEPGGEWSEWEEIGPALLGNPVAFPNADGHLEVFARGPEGVLGHMWQTRPEHGWSEWEDMGPEITGDPAIFANAGGHLEIFAVGPGGSLGHMWQIGQSGASGWSAWEQLGPEMTGDPTLFLNTDGNLEVFALGPDGLLGHRWQTQPDHGWSEWEDIGPALTSKPTVFQNADGHLEVFGKGPDGVLGHIWQVKPYHNWSEWEPMEPALTGDPSVFQNADGRLELFASGPEGVLGHRWQHTPSGVDGWSDWEDVGPTMPGRRPALGQVGTIGGSQLNTPVQAHDTAGKPPAGPSELTADFCIIGAGPSGVTVAEGLVRAGASVVLLESGGLDEAPDAQELNEGLADGPIIKRRWTYLRDGRRRAVQGSASRWGPGFCMPFRTNDYERRDWVAHSGWPLTAEDMAPYEKRSAETFAFEPFGPPEAEGSLVRLRYQFPPDPQIFRTKYLDLLTKARFHPELGTTAVEMKVRGDQVESVRAVRADGDEVRVTANTFVLAAGGVENARTLLLHERTLGTSAMTGRSFMEHPHVLAGTIRLSGVEEWLTGLKNMGESLNVLALDDETLAAEGLLNASVQIRPKGGITDSEVECELYVRAEQAPNPDSRVVLGERIDRLGCAQAVLHWRLLDQDWTTIVRTAELVGAALGEAHGGQTEMLVSADKPWPFDPVGPSESNTSAWGNHHMGTTRMGDDPTESVVDRDLRLHGTGNLYVAGSSVFPTGACANPTFTIVALAHRLVDHLSAQT